MRRGEALGKPPIAIGLICALAVIISIRGFAFSNDTPKARVGGEKTPIQLSSFPTNAYISFSVPKRYAVIVDHKKHIKRLYAKGSRLFQENSWTPVLNIERIEPQGVLFRHILRDHKKIIPFGHRLPGLPHMTLVEGVALTEIHYDFQIVETHPEREPILKRIEDRRAYLVKDVLKESRLLTRQSTLPTSGVKAAQPLSPDGPISKLRITRVDSDTYEVEKESLRPLYDLARRSIRNPTESLGLTTSIVTNGTIELKTAIGDARLDQQGFTLTRLDEAEKLGLRVGDRIISINEQTVTSALSAWGIAATLIQENRDLIHLRVELDREGTVITKTYHLN